MLTMAPVVKQWLVHALVITPINVSVQLFIWDRLWVVQWCGHHHGLYTEQYVLQGDGHQEVWPGILSGKIILTLS